jgi:aspartate aminotransferase-like enzyme
MIREEGIENVWARHTKLASAVQEGCRALGLRLFAEHPSNALTAVWVPNNVEWKKFNSTLKNTHGITVAGGQGELKGKIFRISHLGYYDELDIVSVISALEMTLMDCGFEFEAGVGVKAAQKILLSEVGSQKSEVSKQ